MIAKNLLRFGLLILFLSGMFLQQVCAKTIPVEALADFSTEKPVSTYALKILDDIELDSNTNLKNGYIIEGKIVDVSDPKRLKRDANFVFVPEKYKELDGRIVAIKGYYPAKYTTKLNKKEIAKSAALSVGNLFVKGLSMGYSAVEGAIKNEQDNRLKSTVNAVYEKSPLSYVEKGSQLEIKAGDVFLLNFKVKEEENLPNYEYQKLDE